MVLNEILGTKTPSGCFSLSHNDGEDPFTVPGAKKFEGKDDVKHRNSWLMPRMARRMTKNNKFHVSNWRKEVTVTEDECNNLAAILSEKLGEKEALANLPKACQNMM
jgi:Lon protease-like protein